MSSAGEGVYGNKNPLPLLSDLNLSQFELGPTLGTGSYGRVRLVKYIPTQKYFALKQLKKKKIVQAKQVDHVKSEKIILSQVRHPNIVNYIGSFQDRKYIFILMEYVQGGEFFTHLRKASKFSNDVTCFYIAQVVLAINHLHKKGIIYRDLKPENLLMDSYGNCKITDFGFAKRIEYKTWTLCGTPEYLAPEIILTKGHNKGADWWAVGVLIFEFLAGYPPFINEDPLMVYQSILKCDYKLPWHFDRGAKSIIKKLLEPDITKRLGCMANGVEDIKTHKWFKGIDWEALEAQTLQPPIQPKIKSADDISNFDVYPESQEDILPISEEEQNMYFSDF